MTRTLPANWLRTDAMFAVVLAVMGALMGYASMVAGMAIGDQDDPRGLMLAALALSAPMVLFRRFPCIIAVLVSGLYIVSGYTTGVEVYSGQVVLYLSFYAIGAWENNRRRALWVRVFILAVMAVWLLIETVRGFTSAETGEFGVSAYFAFLLLQWTVNLVFFGAAWMFGERAWKSAAERAELDAAYEQIRSQQEVIATHAIEAERVRIARELHDTVAHHVTVMGIQAAAARRVLDSDASAAREQLRAVEASSRQAVHELQTMVHTLRDSDIERTALPTIADVDELIAQSSSAGQKIEYEIVDGATSAGRGLSPAVELTVYRVVQESLSNARKHAGPSAVVTVTLRYLANGVEVDISDDGWGRASTEIDNRTGFEGTGTGVIGMKERVQALGGTFEAGAKGRGGWLVRAWVPSSAERGTE